MKNPKCLLLVVLGFTSLLPAQLMPGDVIILAFNQITHIRGAAATPVVPVPVDAIALPTTWSEGSCEWIRNTHTVLMGSDLAPFGVYLIDFSSSLSAPTSRRLGTGIGGIRDIDQIESTGDVLVLQNVPLGQGQIDVLTAPVGPTSTLGTVWASGLPIANADYMAVQNATGAVVGGVANIYRIPANSTNGGAQMTLGAWFYNCKSLEIDQATGDLYVGLFNADAVRRLTWTGGIAYADQGNFMMFPEVDGPEDVEWDAANNVVYAICRNGGQTFGLPWGVQPGNDNAIIGNNPILPPGTGFTVLGPISGHGNTGLFANFAIVGPIIANPAGILSYGTGCNSSALTLHTLSNTGFPQIGSVTFTLNIGGGPALGASFLYLAVGANPAPFPITPFCNVHIDITTALIFISSGFSPFGPLPLDGSGALSFQPGIPADPGLIGQSIDTQVLTPDLVPGGLISSNALRLLFGN